MASAGGVFGSPDSCRRRYGVRKDNNLPSLNAHMTYACRGTPEPVTVGQLLVSRSNKPLHVLWTDIEGRVPNARVPIHRLPEKLAAAGCGVLGPRELGQLQRILVPAADGSTGYSEWAAAFHLTGQESIPNGGMNAAGIGTAGITELGIICNMRNETEAARTLQPPGAAAPWPGGFGDASIDEDRRGRLAASVGDATKRERIPFATEADRDRDTRAPATPHCCASPTYAQTIHAPPYATTDSGAVPR